MRHVATLRARCSRAAGESGFTLVELVVALSILLVVIGSLTGALISATNSEADLNTRFQTQTQARLAMTKLTREIHCAGTILDLNGAALTTTTVGGVTVPKAANGVTLTLPAGCPTGGASAVTAKWCTVASGTTWDLYRSVSTTCSSSTGVRWASSLINSTPFSLPPLNTSVSESHDFTLVHVDLNVNTRTSGTGGTYDLTNDIAALNVDRSGT